MYPLITIGS